MKKVYLLFPSICFSIALFSQSITFTGSIYNQDFNTLATSGTTNPLTITGWNIAETGTSSRNNGQYAGDNGSSTSGDTYSYGTTSSTDRALGSLQSGTLISSFGAGFTNNTGATITSLIITYTGEQWRLGATGRTDRLDFQYSTSATSITTGTWTDVDALDFTSPYTATAGTLDGNAVENKTAISHTITGLSIPNGTTFFIRWNDFNATSSDDGLAIDDFSLSIPGGSGDVTPPTLSSLFPVNNSANVSTSFTAAINFSENIQKGTGNIYLKKGSDNSIVQVIDVTTSLVTVSNNQATFAISNLQNSTDYYFEMDAGTFKDLANNNFAGFSGNSTWKFITIAAPANGIIGNTYTFNTCSNYINDGFRTYSFTGAEVWTCTPFGRTYTTDPSSDSAIQMNGFGTSNQINEDWLISPKYNLSATNFPLLKFYSRSRFAGDQLQLKVSTDYSGNGNPAAATWTTINGKFPAVNSDVWTLSDSINLSAFKTSNVYIAWVYTSSTTAASRWSLDDISVINSPSAPLPFLTVNGNLLDFREIASGGISFAKSFSFTATDLTTNLVISAPSGFELSKDTTLGYHTSLSYTPAETQSGQKTVYVRFTPSATNTVYSGYMQFSSTGINRQKVFVKGNSYLAANTLNIVNWNIEWFGASGQGPSNEQLQQDNSKKVMDYLGADAYAVAEIVDATRFANLVSSLNGGYSYVISQFCSGGSSAASCASSQKLAFVYKTSMFSNVTSRGFMLSSSTAFSNWSTGRVPLLVTADVSKNGVTRNMSFIVVHAKANTGTTAEQIDSYNRRKAGVQELKDTLDTHFSNANFIILGDFNDDLDRTIAPTTGPDTVSSYQPMIADSTDADSYKSFTLPLSYFGLSSTTNNPEVIDHVVGSNEVGLLYLNLSASLYNDIETIAGITNYATSTSDHYPLGTRYLLSVPSQITDHFRTKQSGNWNDVNTWESSPDNSTWSSATVTPDFNSNTITIQTSHVITATAHVTIDQTTINGVLVVDPNVVLTVNNGPGTDVSIVSLSGLQIRSTAAGSGSIGKSTGNISGNILFDRYISNRRAWRLLGIPFSVSPLTIRQSWMNDGSSSPAGLGTHITTFTGDSRASNFDAQKPASSIRNYLNDNFNSDLAHTPNTTDNIAANQAYFLFVRGDRSIDRTTAGAASSETILRAHGTPNQGNLIKGVTGTNFSLVPNPYPSHLNFDSIKAIPGNASISTFYVWDATLGTVGQYRTVQITGTAPAYTYTATPGSANNNWRYIESGTAFMIPGSRTVEFTEATKTEGTPPTSMLRVNAGTDTELTVNLHKINSDNTVSLADGIRLVYNDAYSPAIDNEDAKKITGFELNFGISAAGNEVLSIEKRPMPGKSDVILLNLSNTTAGNYQFELNPANFPASVTVAFLRDNYLDVYTPISLKASTNIDFSITGDAGSAAVNRFAVVFSKNAVSPARNSIVVYPNPVQNGMVSLRFTDLPKGMYPVRLVNALGQAVINQRIEHAGGSSVKTLNLNKMKGVYMIEIVKPDNTKWFQKVIVN